MREDSEQARADMRIRYRTKTQNIPPLPSTYAPSSSPGGPSRLPPCGDGALPGHAPRLGSRIQAFGRPPLLAAGIPRPVRRYPLRLRCRGRRSISVYVHIFFFSQGPRECERTKKKRRKQKHMSDGEWERGGGRERGCTNLRPSSLRLLPDLLEKEERGQ